jgi:hypothetical protein
MAPGRRPGPELAGGPGPGRVPQRGPDRRPGHDSPGHQRHAREVAPSDPRGRAALLEQAVQDGQRPCGVDGQVDRPPQLRVRGARVAHPGQARAHDGYLDVGGDGAEAQVEPAAGAGEGQQDGEQPGSRRNHLEQDVHHKEAQRGQRNGPVGDLGRDPRRRRDDLAPGRGHSQHHRAGEGEEGQDAGAVHERLRQCGPAPGPAGGGQHRGDDHDQARRGQRAQRVGGGGGRRHAGRPQPAHRSMAHQTSARPTRRRLPNLTTIFAICP